MVGLSFNAKVKRILSQQHLKMNYSDRLSFIGEFYQENANLTRIFNIYYYSYDNSFELFDVGLKRLFLRRTVVDHINESDLYLGSTICLFGKIIRITDYADLRTRKLLADKRQKTFLMIKPEAKDCIGEIIRIIEENKFQITQLKMLKLQPLNIVQFCTSKVEDSAIPFLLENLTSGPVVVFEILGENAIEHLKKVCGPEDVTRAKEQYPASLRANFGFDDLKCGVFCSEDFGTAQKDLDYFFSKPTGNEKSLDVVPKLYRSCLCLIKPHAVRDGKIGDILSYICSKGYSLGCMRMYHLSRKQCEEFYEIYKGVVGEYLQMVSQLQSGNCLAIEILGEGNVQQDFRDFCGPVDPEVAKILRPKSLRAKFGSTKVLNAIHCTDLNEDTLLELEYFFKILQ